MKLTIISADYGGAEITERVRAQVSRAGLSVPVGNYLAGYDPQKGVKKSLTVKYILNGVEGETRVAENDCLTLPKLQHSRLGIFYSNNINNRINHAALKALEHAALGKADILSCTWKPIQGNPFPEITAMTQHPHHLNIIIQILQLLYRAQDTGAYEYVSMMEHDVLYPEGYFDFPDFDSGVLYNTNFKGVCREGYQDYAHVHDSRPLHQMTLRFRDAITHFQRLIPWVLRHGRVILEPARPVTKWVSLYPAVHVNHGENFTGHSGLYTAATHETDSYWGDYRRLEVF